MKDDSVALLSLEMSYKAASKWVLTSICPPWIRVRIRSRAMILGHYFPFKGKKNKTIFTIATWRPGPIKAHFRWDFT